MKSKSFCASCPHCLSAQNDTVAEFVYFDCTSSFNIKTQILDQSKQCVKREKIIAAKMLDFIKIKKKKQEKKDTP